jgi:uncharacterized repeat protein (TIGR01451 family)
MKKIFLKLIFTGTICLAFALPSAFANAQSVGGVNIQTNSASSIYSNQATLNGYFGYPYFYSGDNYVWFQWGSGTGYGNETSHKYISGNSGYFTENISNLNYNSTYHFRAVIQNNYGTFHGQDMTFSTTGSSGYTSGSLSVQKRVINLTSGNLNWQSSTTAKPGDVLSFSITLQAIGRDIHNIVVTDILPPNLIYTGKLMINAILSSGNPTYGINIGTLPAGQLTIISYQAQVPQSVNYGTTTVSSNSTVTSSESGAQTSLASVTINNFAVQGITYLPTGTTNNIINDSFFIPLTIIILAAWLYFSGRVYKFADWLKK